MKKVIPVLIAIVLIGVIAATTFGAKIVEKYSYSQERVDLYEFFDLYSDHDIAIFLQDERLTEKAQYRNGEIYFNLDFVHERFSQRFYYDEVEQLLLYTTPTEIIRTVIGSQDYTILGCVMNEAEVRTESKDYPLSYMDGEGVYLAAKWVAEHSDLQYELFEDPLRMKIETRPDELVTGIVKKDTAVRQRGGVKSPILTEVHTGDEVVILEQMEEWSKVMTADCFVGYLENKRLDDAQTISLVYDAPSYVEPEASVLPREEKINLVWHQIFAPQSGADLKEALKETSGINVISPTVFSLFGSDGTFNSLASKDYVETAHALGLEVWALIDNFNENVSTKELLSSTSRREKLRKTLIEVTLSYGFDGINIDFEQVPMSAGRDYIEFIRELSIDCHACNLVLSVDNYVPTDYTDHYDRAEQGIYADYVIIMGYDEHYAGSAEAGSVASIDFVTNGIADTCARVPAAKVINALPFYTRIWKTEGGSISSEATGMGAAAKFLSSNGVEPVWDETTCQNYAEFQKGDIFYQIWLEDEQSIQTKLNVMTNYDLAGVAGWKLGLERSYVWDLIGGYLD